MNKYEYLAQLRAGLAPLSLEEREAAMSYYEEFFSDAGEENEQAVIASLGSPEQLAKSIIDENKSDSAEETAASSAEAAPADSTSGFTPPPTNGQQAKKWTGGQLTLLIVLLVLASPAIIGIICGGFGTLIGLIAGFGSAAIGCFVGGIWYFGLGIGTMFTDVIHGLLYMGIGLIFTGLGPLVFYPLCKLIVKLFGICVKGIKALINKISGKGGVEA